MEKPNIEQYLDAKYVSDNPSKFDFRDVSQARQFCDGFEGGMTHALQIAERAVDVVMSQFTYDNDRRYWYNEATKEILSEIKTLTDE